MTEIMPTPFNQPSVTRSQSTPVSGTTAFSSVLQDTHAQIREAVQASTLFDQTPSLTRKRRVQPMPIDTKESDDPNALLNGLKKAIKRLIQAERHQAGL